MPTPKEEVGQSVMNEGSKSAQVCEDAATLRQGMPQYDGVYVHGRAHGVSVVFTVDTGATTTIVASRVYEKISEAERPALERLSRTRRITVADGVELNVLGKTCLDLQLGPVLLKSVSVSVAEIEDDVLLGTDVLRDGHLGPANILLSECRIVMSGMSIPISRSEPWSANRCVRVAERTVVPGLCEALVDMRIDRGSSFMKGQVMIEPLDDIPAKRGLAVAPVLVKAGEGDVVKVRVLNPWQTPLEIRPNVVMARAVPVQGEVITLAKEEDSAERDNFSTVRRIGVREPTGVEHMEYRGAKLGEQPMPEHVKDMYEEAIRSQPSEMHGPIRNLILEYADIFSKDDTDLGLIHGIEHEIHTGDARPVKQPPRRTPLAFQSEEREAIEKLVAQGTVRPSMSPWASPIVFVRKRDGKLRTCFDYRRLNSLTTKDAFPLPRISSCLDALSGAKVISTLDITSAYNQIPVKETDIPKTAFVTKSGLFECTTMSFGLTNAPATFQRAMEMVLSGLNWITCLVYLDDVIIHAKSAVEHVSRVSV